MVAQRCEKEEPQRRGWTWEEYLEFDANAEWKYEFVNGRVHPVGFPDCEISPDDVIHRGEEIRALAGASLLHNRIVSRINRSLGNQLDGTSCESFVSDMRVQVNEAGQYVYPDVVVACEPQLADSPFDTLLNPAVVIEVLSPATIAYDRSEKWALYQQLPSLRDYLMIATGAPRVEWYSRQEGQQESEVWLYRVVEGLGAQVQLASIGGALRLREIYERIDFTAREQQQEEATA